MPGPVRKNSNGWAFDAGLLFPTLFLVGIGIVMIYSASSALALKKFGTDYYFLKKQLLFAFLGLGVMILCRYVPYRLYRLLAYPLLGLAVALLLMVEFSPFGYAAGGAVRWLKIGAFTFQPSEFARLAMVTYLAYSISRKQELMGDFYIGFLPHMLVFALFTALIFSQPDFGSVVILGSITYIMLFVGGSRLLHLLSTILLLLPPAYFFMISAEYRLKRWLTFLNPWEHPTTEGYQIIQSWMAFGTGGLWGVGLGQSLQKLFYLPEPHTDFIFAVIGEELGLLGTLFILGTYVALFWRGIWISRHAPDPFGSLLALGLTVSLGLQVCVNMGVTLGLLPTKGLTLPFLSYGGTSLVINMAAIGILMNIGAQHRS